MNRTDIAYIVNSTPKYYYLLEAHFGLLNLYASDMKWPIYFGTETPEEIRLPSNVNIVHLQMADAGFWESRIATIKALPSTIKYILPMQEDFLLERPGVNWQNIQNVLDCMDGNPKIISARLMPCPGPRINEPLLPGWSALSELDNYLFTFQATIWKREYYLDYLKQVVELAKKRYPNLSNSEWNKMAVNENLAENSDGRSIFLKLFKDYIHLAWIRNSKRANAVYDCPWPYRPTAVVKGVLQAWAQELIEREGFSSKIISDKKIDKNDIYQSSNRNPTHFEFY